MDDQTGTESYRKEVIHELRGQDIDLRGV